MFGSKKPPQPSPPPSPPKVPKRYDWTWQVLTHGLGEEMLVLIVNHGMMGQMNKNGRANFADSVKFAAVRQDDPDFEEKWADALKRAHRRCDVLNMDTKFHLDDVDRTLAVEQSLCSNCEKAFVGEDYLCPACKEER